MHERNAQPTAVVKARDDNGERGCMLGLGGLGRLGGTAPETPPFHPI
jgi:hypothetical protein